MTADIIDFSSARFNGKDHLIRATAAEGMVRAFSVSARDTVQTARENHDTSPVVTAALGRLMMGALMTGAMFKEPDELITFIVRGDGPIGAMTVTANCEGQVKGFAANPQVWLPLTDAGKLDVGGAVGAGTLSAVRDIPGQEPYASTVELVSGEIGEDLTQYFMTSDQVPTSVGVGVLVGRDLDVECAGGFIVQLMPGCPDEVIGVIEDNLEKFTSVTGMMSEGARPRDLLACVLDGLGFQELEAQAVEFKCGCGKERVERSVIALGKDALQEMLDAGEDVEVTCHFCGKRHVVTAKRVAELYDEGGLHL